MEPSDQTTITVQILVEAPVNKVWENWTNPEHITQWNHASDDWHAPYAENDLRKDGQFKTTMAAKDGSLSFDFEGVYTEVENYTLLAYVIADGRKVQVRFDSEGSATRVTEIFDPENIHPIELQREGWQAILDNFKKYTESIA